VNIVWRLNISPVKKQHGLLSVTGSDSAPAPHAGTKTVLELESGISCAIEAGRISDDELRSIVPRYSVKTAAQLLYIMGSHLRGMKLASNNCR